MIRQGNMFAVQQNSTIVLENVTFEEARKYLADNGNEDAAKPLYNHSNLGHREQWIEPEFRGEVELHSILGRR